MSCPDQLVVSLAGIASIADAASSQLLSRTRKTYGRIFGEGQPRLSFERDDVFAMRFEMDPPEAAGFGAHDRMARRFNPADALAVWGPQFELAGDTRAQCRQKRDHSGVALQEHLRRCRKRRRSWRRSGRTSDWHSADSRTKWRGGCGCADLRGHRLRASPRGSRTMPRASHFCPRHSALSARARCALPLPVRACLAA